MHIKKLISFSYLLKSLDSRENLKILLSILQEYLDESNTNAVRELFASINSRFEENEMNQKLVGELQASKAEAKKIQDTLLKNLTDLELEHNKFLESGVIYLFRMFKKKRSINISDSTKAQSWSDLTRAKPGLQISVLKTSSRF